MASGTEAEVIDAEKSGDTPTALRGRAEVVADFQISTPTQSRGRGTQGEGCQDCPPRRPDRKFQWVWLLLSSGTIVLSMLMQIRNSQQVTVPFTEIPLPELCSFRRMTGMDCAGCGMTRCFISLGHGDLAGAWSYSPAGILLYGIVLFQIPFRAWQLWRIRRGLPELYLAHYGYSGMVLFAVLMVAQWGIKLAASYF